MAEITAHHVLFEDTNAAVPFEGSGKRAHEALPGSELHVIVGGPHGVNVSHAGEWNRVLMEFLRADLGAPPEAGVSTGIHTGVATPNLSR